MPSNPNLQKIIKLTQNQYDILSNGGTVGSYTGLNDNYLYLIQDNTEYITDVKINNSSIVNSGIANFVTNTVYNASTNKIATMSDLPNMSNYYAKNESLISTSTNTYDIGSSSYTWKDLYLSGKIDFGGVASAKIDNNLLKFYYGNNAGLGLSSNTIYANFTLGTTHVRPQINNTYDLGTSSYAFKDLYLTNAINFRTTGAYIKVGGSNEIYLTTSEAKFDGNIIPWSDNTFDLGKTGGTWQDLYLSRNLTDGTNSITIANIASKSEIPTVNNGTLTIQKNGTNVQTFTANQSNNVTANITVPTTLNELNDRTADLIKEPNYTYGTPTISTMARVDRLRANRFAGGLHPSSIIVESSTDAGSTWQSMGLTNNQKLLLLSNRGSNIYIPLKNGVKSTDCMIRLTLSGIEFNDTVKALPESERFAQMTPTNWYINRVYATVSDLYFWLSANSDRIAIDVFGSKGESPNTWVKFGSHPNATGWSGMDTVHLSQDVSFGGGQTQTGNYWFIRITFRTCASDGSFDDSKLSTSSTTIAQNIGCIMGYGANCWSAPNPMGDTDRPYFYMGNDGTYLNEVYRWKGSLNPNDTNTYNLGWSDRQWNTIYGKSIYGVTLYENGTSLSNKYLALGGGTLTGKLTVKSPIFGYEYNINNNRAAFMLDKPGGNLTGMGSHAETDTIYFGACDSNGDWVDTYKQKWKFNGTIIEDGTSLADKYQAKDPDLTAIAGLSGTSGLLKKTAADTWALDTTTYLSKYQPGFISLSPQGGGQVNTFDIRTNASGSPRLAVSGGPGITVYGGYTSNLSDSNVNIYYDDDSTGLTTFTTNVSGDASYTARLPRISGEIALDSTVSKYQSSSVIVGNATTNINGRVFQNYTATLITSGGYTFYQILKNGANPTEEEAKEYMRYMTGSTFLPTYNYDFPKQTIFTFADRSTWKPQYSSTDGLRLYRLTTSLALASDIPSVLSTGASNKDKFLHTNASTGALEWSSGSIPITDLR